MPFQPAERIAGFKSYYFVTLGEKIQKLRKAGKDIIRLDIGSPDLPPTPEIIDTLCQSAKKPSVHGYTLHAGTKSFREAVAQYYQNRFGVDVSPDNEILALVGSKEGLFNLCQAFLNPGDTVLIPTPGYPVYRAAVQIAGAVPYYFQLKPENNYLPDFTEIPTDIAQKAKMIWLNYPNNPTGAIASLEFFEKAVAFAKSNDILLVHDAPYTDLCFDDYIAPSLLEINGAKDVAVEFNSASKTYNMAGWRVGYVCGNSEVIGFLKTYKSQMDSANFLPTLEASIFALTSDQSWLKERNTIYQERRDIILEGLQKIGILVEAPKASLYVWAPIPDQFDNALEFCQRCLDEIGVSVAPGSLYGEGNERLIRISLGCKTEQVREAMERLVSWC